MTDWHLIMNDELLEVVLWKLLHRQHVYVLVKLCFFYRWVLYRVWKCFVLLLFQLDQIHRHPWVIMWVQSVLICLSVSVCGLSVLSLCVVHLSVLSLMLTNSCWIADRVCTTCLLVMLSFLPYLWYCITCMLLGYFRSSKSVSYTHLTLPTNREV